MQLVKTILKYGLFVIVFEVALGHAGNVEGITGESGTAAGKLFNVVRGKGAA